MTDTHSFSSDDPRLTAFALGELEGEELAAVEAALRDDPAARAAVAEIRATIAQLESALASEAASDVSPSALPPLRGAAIVAGEDRSKLDGGPLGKVIKFPRIKFPQLYYIAGGLAAAAFAVLVAYRQPPARTSVMFERVKKSEVQLLALPTVAQEAAAKDEAPAPSDAAAQETKPGYVRALGIAAPSRQLALGVEQDKVALANAPAPAAMSAPAPTNLLKEAPAAFAQNRFIQSTNSYERKQAVADNVQAMHGAQEAEAEKMRLLAPAARSATGTVGGKVGDQKNTGTEVAAGVEFNASLSPVSGMRQESPPRLEAQKDSSADVARSYAVRAKTLANTESYAYQNDNDFLGAKENPLSTFSLDVDTASYANVRRFITEGRLPPPDAVRIEELVNYFPYHYAPPALTAVREEGDLTPLAATMEVAEAPWAPTHRLVRIGLKGREVSTAARGAANLVFLLDVSGSMDEPNKLPLVKESMRLLLGKLRPDDRVAIVVYAGASGLALPSTPVAKSREILEALDTLTPGGSTNGGMGIQLAYDIAKANFVTGGLNRVILCTDGDFNVGVTGEGDLTRLIEKQAKSGVFLTVLGFGMGNIKDSTLESLADKGNGNYGYIDTRREAEKLLVEQVNGTLLTIAKDVKLQVEFNPGQVASYRLIGYENRLLKKEDFNNDAVDAGEMGAGHTVTALYEVVPTSQVKGDGLGAMGGASVDPLKYQEVRGQKSAVSSDSDRASENRNSRIENQKSRELLTLKVRFKDAAGAVSRKLEFSLTDGGARFADASADFKFAAAVAEFGMILRESPHKGSGTLADVRGWAEAGTDGDAGGYRSEFVGLVRQAEALLK